MLNPEFALNAEQRCACLLLLDASSSMTGAPMAELNAGLQVLQTDLQSDALAKQRVESAVVTFGGVVRRVQEFVTADVFQAPILSCSGGTPMGQAIEEGIAMVKARKAEYKAAGVAYLQPWVFLITDGQPTDAYESAIELVRSETASKGLIFFAVGVGSANFEILKRMTDRVLKLEGLSFREMFVWLSQSQRGKSKSKQGELTGLAPVTFGSPA